MDTFDINPEISLFLEKKYRRTPNQRLLTLKFGAFNKTGEIFREKHVSRAHGLLPRDVYDELCSPQILMIYATIQTAFIMATMERQQQGHVRDRYFDMNKQIESEMKAFRCKTMPYYTSNV